MYLDFISFVLIIVTIGPLRPHALDIEILFWEVDRLCLHPQAMSVYYQKGITCLTAQVDLTRDSRGLGQVQIIIWAIMFSLLCHISSHLLNTFGIVTKCLNWHVRVPEKFYWMQNKFGQRTPNNFRDCNVAPARGINPGCWYLRGTDHLCRAEEHDNETILITSPR